MTIKIIVVYLHLEINIINKSNMRKAKIIETEEEGFANEPYMGQCTFLHKDGTMSNLYIENIIFLGFPESENDKINKLIEAHKIVFQGQCELATIILDKLISNEGDCNERIYSLNQFINKDLNKIKQ